MESSPFIVPSSLTIYFYFRYLKNQAYTSCCIIAFWIMVYCLKYYRIFRLGIDLVLSEHSFPEDKLHEIFYYWIYCCS